MDKKRALQIIETIRKNFWGKARGFDGKSIIKARNELEKQTIPISQNEAFLIINSGSFFGKASLCVNTKESELKFMRRFWKRYIAEKQIIFASILMGSSVKYAKDHNKNYVCDEKQKKIYEAFIKEN